MKVLICGGRTYSDRKRVFEVLDYLHNNRAKITLLVHGAATGADTLGKEWARERGVRFWKQRLMRWFTICGAV